MSHNSRVLGGETTFRIDSQRQGHGTSLTTISDAMYLQTVENDSRQAQPAVQAVHVGDFGGVVEVEHCHHGYDNESEG